MLVKVDSISQSAPRTQGEKAELCSGVCARGQPSEDEGLTGEKSDLREGGRLSLCGRQGADV